MPPLFANRYSPLAEASRDLRAPVLARDVVFDRIVVFKSLGPTFGQDLSARGNLAHVLDVLRTLPPERLVRYFGVEETADDFLLVREWVPGFSLLDLLRRQRSLSVRTYVRLLSSLPETFDLLAKNDLPLPPFLLEKVLFSGDESDDPALLAPLKFDPLETGGFAAIPRENVTAFAPRQNDSAHPFARMLYEVFGGHPDGRFTPLAALNEEGNARLQAFLRGGYADCATFWGEFVSAVDPTFSNSPPAPAKRTDSQLRAWEIAGTVSRGAPTGNVLRLVPGDAGASPIHLVARASFEIGRAYHEADFTARLLPENEENYERTGRISRVHVHGEIIDGSATLRAVTHNGTWFNGHPLPADPAATLSHRGILDLSNEYRLEVVPLFHDHVSDCRFNDFAGETACVEQETRGDTAERLHGGVTFIPLDGQPPLHDAVWLFTGIGFGLDPEGNIIWDYDGSGDSPGALLFHEDRFWIKNLALPEESVVLGDIPIQRHQVAPLAPGSELHLGARLYFLR